MGSLSIPFVTTTLLLYSIRGYKQSSIIVTQFPIMKIYVWHIKIFMTFFVCFQAETHYADQYGLELASLPQILVVGLQACTDLEQEEALLINLFCGQFLIHTVYLAISPEESFQFLINYQPTTEAMNLLLYHYKGDNEIFQLGFFCFVIIELGDLSVKA